MLPQVLHRSWPVAALSALVFAMVGGAAAHPDGSASAVSSRHHGQRAEHYQHSRGSCGVHTRRLPPPSQFVSTVTNPYMPWIPGTRWFYVGGDERIAVHVLHRTRMIEGIKATVVRDSVKVGGAVIEDTFDWYAQDRHGNVWYLGENTREYEDGHIVSREGSWEAGVDGAVAGVAMFARPRVGVPYRQEYYAGHAEDVGKVLELSTRVVVPAGHYRRVRMTLDTTTLDRAVAEVKFYAPGVGVVRELDLNPEQADTQLVRMVRP